MPAPAPQQPSPAATVEAELRGAWVYVGHMGDLARPGSSFPATLGGLPVAVTRDRDDRLRALVAVCRHQGAAIRQPAGPAASLRCAYHGWTYGLDGGLLAAPHRRGDPRFDPAAHGLPELPVARWGPFVFAAADPAVPPLAEALGDLPARVEAAVGARVGALRFQRRRRERIAAGWGDVAAQAAAAGAYLLRPATTVHPTRGALSIGALRPAGPGATERFLDDFVEEG